MADRYLRNLLTTGRALRRAFPPQLLDAIERAIAASERRHSGELRFVIEAALDVPTLLRGHTARDRAIEVFAHLRTWDTAANNGVLIYLLLAERDIEIVADRGYRGKVSDAEWQEVCEAMQVLFQGEQYQAGSLRGIDMVTGLISRHFPPAAGDRNELPDRPVVL